MEQSGFLMSMGTPVKNGQQINGLPAPILLPSEIAVNKTGVCTKKIEPEYQRNTPADSPAKATTTQDTMVVAHIAEVYSASAKKMETRAPTYTSNIGNYPAYNNPNTNLEHYVPSKALNACLQRLTTNRMISLRPECSTEYIFKIFLVSLNDPCIG